MRTKGRAVSTLPVANACATGLWVDRLHDPLWKLLIEARERAGDPVAASRARRDYARVLEELGLTASGRL